MKSCIHIAWFFLLVWWISITLADISLALKNKEYLSPAIQELPINGDYVRAQQQKKFKENNYGNSRYQFFEIHSHRKVSNGRGENNQASSDKEIIFANNNYAPSQKNTFKKIVIEHTNAPADFPLNDPNLDAAYLSFATENNDNQQQIIVQHETRNNIAVPFSSNFRHTFSEKLQNAAPNALSFMQQYAANYRGSDYLPPETKIQQYFVQPVQKDYQASRQRDQSNSNQKSSNIQDFYAREIVYDGRNNKDMFKEPDYMPPQQQKSVLIQQSSVYENPIHSLSHEQASLQPNEFFQSSKYSPSHQNFEHTSTLKGSDYEGYYQAGFQQFEKNIITKSQFKGLDYLPPQTNFKVSNFLPSFRGLTKQQQNIPFRASEQFKDSEYFPPGNSQEISSNQNVQRSTNSWQPIYGTRYFNNSFKGADYLPPLKNQLQSQQQQNLPDGFEHSSNPFKSPYYSPPQETQTKPTFKGPDYLSPVSNQLQPQQQQSRNLPDDYEHETKQSNNPFKGPDYLPPQQSQTKPTFKGPDYLPPVRNLLQSQKLPQGYDFQKPPNAEQAIEELHKLPDDSPATQVVTQSAGHDESASENYGPTKSAETDSSNYNLPLGYDFEKPQNSEQAIKLLHSQETSTTSNTPSIQESQRSQPAFPYPTSSDTGAIDNQLQNLDFFQQQFLPKTDAIVNSFATNYNFRKPVNDEQVTNKIHDQRSFHESKQQQVTQRSRTHQTATQQFVSLQQTRNFVNHPDPNYLPTSEGSGNFNGSKYLPPTLGPQTFGSADYLQTSLQYQATNPELGFNSVTEAFKNPEYLPPVSAPKNNKDSYFSKPINSHKVFEGSDYLPPINKQPSSPTTAANQFEGPHYLPPTESKSSIMYPLSSYMTNIKPSDRYGNGQSFPDYGLLPAKTIKFRTSDYIAPMYQQPTPKPQYYAPAMSYANNTFSSQIPSQQGPHALRTFMPEEIRETTATNHFQASISSSEAPRPLQVSKPATAKVRTVQIVNPNAIKTLKVLESLDDTGIKTIKILGSSNESPMGQHHVVNVVSGSKEQSVQTIKIFSDQQDLLNNGNAASSSVEKGNSYFPPRTKQYLQNELNA